MLVIRSHNTFACDLKCPLNFKNPSYLLCHTSSSHSISTGRICHIWTGKCVMIQDWKAVDGHFHHIPATCFLFTQFFMEKYDRDRRKLNRNRWDNFISNIEDIHLCQRRAYKIVNELNMTQKDKLEYNPISEKSNGLTAIRLCTRTSKQISG